MTYLKIYLISLILMAYMPSVRVQHGIPASSVVVKACGYGWVLFSLVAIGRKYPSHAIKSVFYTIVLICLWSWGSIAFVLVQHGTLAPGLSGQLLHSSLMLPLWTTIEVSIAYLVSVTKRGWYGPTLADFKLTLPKRWQVAK